MSKPAASRSFPYADLPLSEALVAFRRDHGLEEKYRAMRPEAQRHYELHDMVHVLFGLDTTMRQEAHADGWTLFGTDITREEIAEFFGLPEEKELVAELGWPAILKGYLGALPDYFSIVLRSRRLRRKWPWSANEALRSRTVGSLRNEFGIMEALLR